MTDKNVKLCYEVFRYMLEGAITNSQVAYEAAKGLEFFKSDARDLARQRRMNQMVENQVIQIEEAFNIVIAVEGSVERNKVPFPQRVIRNLSIRNYHNGLGRSDGSRPDDWEKAIETE